MITVHSAAFLRHSRAVMMQTDHWQLWIFFLIKEQRKIINRIYCDIFKLKKHMLLCKSGRRGVKNRESEAGRGLNLYSILQDLQAH